MLFVGRCVLFVVCVVVCCLMLDRCLVFAVFLFVVRCVFGVGCCLLLVARSCVLLVV